MGTSWVVRLTWSLTRCAWVWRPRPAPGDLDALGAAPRRRSGLQELRRNERHQHHNPEGHPERDESRADDLRRPLLAERLPPDERLGARPDVLPQERVVRPQLPPEARVREQDDGDDNQFQPNSGTCRSERMNTPRVPRVKGGARG